MSQTATSTPRNGLKGLAIERRFSSPGTHPFDQIEWETRDAVIGDPADHLFDRALALLAPHLPAEVLLGDDVGRVLAPALGELDPALLEGRRGRIADHGIARLPLDLVEGMRPWRGEAAFDRQALETVFRSTGGGLGHRTSPLGGTFRGSCPGLPLRRTERAEIACPHRNFWKILCNSPAPTWCQVRKLGRRSGVPCR